MGVVLAALSAVPAGASITASGSDGPAEPVSLQLLTFNDFHGNLQPPSGRDATLGLTVDPTATPVGGAEYLASKLAQLRAQAPNSITAVAGDLIGASPFLSAAFHDEPTIESMNAMGVDVAGVGNHEFDEGIPELLRMVRGGCRADTGCYFRKAPYKGTEFPYLAANVYRKGTTKTVLPATTVVRRAGIKVGFIGLTLADTPLLVDQRGIRGYRFGSEVKAINKAARRLGKKGVRAIVVLIHEGGAQSGTKDQCIGASGPILGIAAGIDPAVDVIVSGHTHQAYICQLADPAGQPRLLTSAASFGRLVTETRLSLDPITGEVLRSTGNATNHLVDRAAADPRQTAIINKWQPLAGRIGDELVGRISGDILTAPNRDAESSMANLVADAQLAATAPSGQGGAQIAVTNPGGVRASLLYAPSARSDGTMEPEPGMVRYSEAYATQPFGNTLVTVDLTGAQVQAVLEEQYRPDRPGGAPKLILGVSRGLRFEWVESAPAGQKVPDESVTLDGAPLVAARTYRVAMNSFLAGGGDGFTTLSQGRNPTGGSVDLDALLAYLGASKVVDPPATDRIIER